MSVGVIQILIILFVLALWLGVYSLGNYICKKNQYLRKNINKQSIIIISLVLLPIVMAITKEGFFYGLGWALVGPFLANTLIHWLFPIIIKRRKIKTKNFFNENFYYGYLGFIGLAFISLLDRF